MFLGAKQISRLFLQRRKRELSSFVTCHTISSRPTSSKRRFSCVMGLRSRHTESCGA